MAEAKPPYRVPKMAEIAAIPDNGLRVASLFAGAGGSSLGYRLAGYRVLYANEFVPAAQETYRANAVPDTAVDGRDVREIKAAEVLKACRMAPGDLDLLDGSPPCQGFSMAGRREKGWGTEREYGHGAKQKNEDLFFEFVRLRDGIRPKVFVAENVSGLVKGAAKGYFLEILKSLKRGYQVEARLLDAQWLGVPQARQRIIFVGVRLDLKVNPAFPDPLPYRYSVRDALPWIAAASHDNPFKVEAETDISRYAIGREYDKLNPGQQSEKYFSLVRAAADKPSPTVMSSSGAYESGAAVMHPTEKRRFSIAELKRISSFPDDFGLTGTYADQWERLGNSVPPVMMFHVAEAIRDRVLLPAPAASARSSSATRRERSNGRGRSPPASPAAASSPAARSPRRRPAAPTDAK